MAISILGFAISGLVAAVFLFVGALALLSKKGLGSSIRNVLGMIPIGSPKLWGAIFLIVGIVAGGIGYTTTGISGLIGGVSTASLTGDKSDTQAAALNCYFNTPSIVAAGNNVTFRADPNNLQHYYADVKYDSGAASINGTLSCDSNRADISKGAAAICHVEAGAYKSETSTTDSNTYYILATSSSKSKVAGYSWSQTGYLNDNAVATTSSDKEQTTLAFAQDEVNQKLGYYLTLPGATAFSYLNNQTANDVKIVCDGSTVGTLTVVKTSA